MIIVPVFDTVSGRFLDDLEDRSTPLTSMASVLGCTISSSPKSNFLVPLPVELFDTPAPDKSPAAAESLTIEWATSFTTFLPVPVPAEAASDESPLLGSTRAGRGSLRISEFVVAETTKQNHQHELTTM